ncbi:MAG: histidine kinase [Oscillospiraceae bacterium]|nr:histidine kinase [Oscillospiraceae bacterium]
MKKKQKEKGFSLRWGLIGIVLSCWVLPMIVILSALAFYTNLSVQRHFDETVRASISGAVEACRRSLGEAVAASRFASYDGTIQTAYREYAEHNDRLLLHGSVQDFLDRSYKYDDNFLATIIFLHSEPQYLYHTFNPRRGAAYSNVQEYERDVHGSVIDLASELDTKIAFANINGSIYMIRNLVNSDLVPYAAIVSLLNHGLMFSGFGNIVWETGATLYLNGAPVGIVLDSPHPPLLPIPLGYSLSSGEQVVTDRIGAILVYGRESVDAVDIRYVVEVDRQGFLRGFFGYTDIGLLLLLFTVPLLMLAILFFYRNIFKPIDSLVSAADNIQRGALGYQVGGLVGNREFRYLNEAFNGMSARIKQQFEQIYSEELALRDARIMALQSQINPHFLNNTLEIINWEARLGNNANVSKIIEALAVMLEAAMDRKSLPLVPLAQEMMYVDSYLYIASTHFGDRLVIEKDIDPSLLQYKVPRLIMQPIIENAVEHGVGSGNNGVIAIAAERQGAYMKLDVYNNAVMSEKDAETAARLLSPDYDARSGGSLHLGIHNVNIRLKMIYGESSGLSITSDGRGTTVSFAVPLDFDDSQITGELI